MIRFNIPPIKRFFLFLCISALCFVIGAAIIGLITYGGVTPTRLRLSTLLQDILLFIIPAIGTAMIITRQPADFLLLRNKPSLKVYLLITATILASVPAMNSVINWNASLSLPESLSELEIAMRSAEEAAASSIQTLIGGNSVPALILALLIISVLAGFSEELYFRGTIQRLFSTGGINHHVAIIITAIIFSAIHMQFFGFVPRMILGIYFGYLIVWCGSIWPAIWAHVLNNALAVIAIWTESRGENVFNALPGFTESNVNVTTATISLILTLILLIITVKISAKK